MIRTFFVEFVFPCLLFLFVRMIIRNMFASMRANARPRPAAGNPPIESGGDLKRDPVCGTYVSPAASVQRTIAGQTVHFCSEQCSRRYVAR
jgi:YHS domain-containing protein